MNQPTNTDFIRSQKQTRVPSEVSSEARSRSIGARPQSVGKELRVDLLSGSDPTEGIVSVQADYNGNVTLWRRIPSASLKAGPPCGLPERSFEKVVVEKERFHNWFIISDRSLLTNTPDHHSVPRVFDLTELGGDFPLRWLVETQQYTRIEKAVVGNFNRKHHDNKTSFFSLGREQVFSYASPVEQYLVKSGRTYFNGNLGYIWEFLPQLRSWRFLKTVVCANPHHHWIDFDKSGFKLHSKTDAANRGPA